jgi:Ca2+-binding EF-hand superfamily protein
LLAFNIRSKGKLEERLTWTFNIYDTNNDNMIDMKELKKMFDILFTMLNVDRHNDKYSVEKYVSDVITKFDLSGDKQLSLEEFVQGVKNDEPLKKLILDHQLD